MARLSNKYNPLLKTYPESQKINSVTEGAEVLYVRLIAACDDAGRYWGDAGWVANRLFTARILTETVRIRDVENRLVELEKVGLIARYWVGKERFLEILNCHKAIRCDVEPKLLFPPRLTENGTGCAGSVPPTSTSTSTQPNPIDVDVDVEPADADEEKFVDVSRKAIAQMSDWDMFDWLSIVDDCRELRGQFNSKHGLSSQDRDLIVKVEAMVRAKIIDREWIKQAVRYSRGRSIRKPFAAFHSELGRIAEESGLVLNRLLKAVKVPEKFARAGQPIQPWQP